MHNKDHPSTTSEARGLSYKFQRLRERVRQSVACGELTGKLPGERELARRFKCNAKTLSKALTDLAAEGLLDRSIGRGTYVKGSQPAVQPADDRWLILCDAAEANSALVRALLKLKPASRIVCGIGEMRPSVLALFSAVIDCASDTPDKFHRDLIVRGMPVISVGQAEPRMYSVHGVYIDRALAAHNLGRDLLLAGHQRIGAIDVEGSTVIPDALRHAAARYAPQAVVETCFIGEVVGLVETGVSALVCSGSPTARAVREMLLQRQMDVPGRVSLATIACDNPADEAISGYYVDPTDRARAVAELLMNLPSRPMAVWLTAVFVDHGTISPNLNLISEPSRKMSNAALAS
ncbi:MAG TPA: GntR family transcriptional regulator [Tepidisphaeraceae bacterium]|jgi:DNA-binding transcriptional regulator YhcF (GntR family)